eukprot:gene25957-32468_t
MEISQRIGVFHRWPCTHSVPDHSRDLARVQGKTLTGHLLRRVFESQNLGGSGYGRGTLKLASVGARGRSNCGRCSKRTRRALSPPTGQACSRCIWMLNAPAGRRHPPHKGKADGHSYNP